MSAAAILSISGNREGFSAPRWSPRIPLLLAHLLIPSPLFSCSESRGEHERMVAGVPFVSVCESTPLEDISRDAIAAVVFATPR